ncbi:MAG: methyl-accepting chemotaxis protein [Elusimicrobia bacterium]|nr:methyl-accepting chemotaxis protein [Elusimicrobiota bacterium]
MNASETPNAPAPQRSRLFGRRIIKPRFQIKFSLAIFALLSLMIGAIWWSGNQFIVHMVDAGLIQKTDAVTHVHTLTHVIIRSVMFTWILAFGVALFYSHLIAGPIYRFGHVLGRMKQGDLTLSVRLRRFDEFQDLAKDFDEVLGVLRQKARGDREFVFDRLSLIEKRLEEMRNPSDPEKIDGILGQIREIKEKPSSFLY